MTYTHWTEALADALSLVDAAEPTGTYAVYGSRDDRTAALALCRGEYQRQVVRGVEPLSGAGLRGKASQWGASYARSRASLCARLRAAGLGGWEVRGPHGRRVLVIARAA